jgi:copper chaperone CopZ
MKTLGSIIVLALVIMACSQRSGTSVEQQSDLVDTMQFKQIVLHIQGMTCEGCENTISKTVGQLAGVKNVKASHMDSLATIVYDTSLSSALEISESINNLGYKVVGELLPEP